MGNDRRVTLRCLTEDLSSGWGRIDHRRTYEAIRAALERFRLGELRKSDIARLLRDVPRTNSIDHPLISHFDEQFADDNYEAFRESISGLTDPHWWKQKTSRWRGAACDHARIDTGEVWLCAAGLRAKGDSRDFYTSFMKSVLGGGAEQFLPKPEDRDLTKVEDDVSKFDAWTLQLHLTSRLLVADALAASGERVGPVDITNPTSASNRLLCKLWVQVDTIAEHDGTLRELTLHIEPAGFDADSVVAMATNHLRSAICPTADAWIMLPAGPEGRRQTFSADLTAATVAAVRTTQESCTLDEDYKPVHLKCGTTAHYTKEDQIVEATVEGSSVRALCGHWFVPTRPPDDKPVCTSCQSEHAKFDAE